MNKTLLLFCLLITGITSCDTPGCSYLIFDNATERDIVVQLFYTQLNKIDIDTILILSGEEKVVWEDCAAGGRLAVYPTGLGLDSIFLDSPGYFSKGFNSSTGGKNPVNDEFWTETYGSKGSRNMTYISFVINSEDIDAWIK